MNNEDGNLTAGDIGGSTTRTLVAAGVAYAAGKGYIPADMMSPELITALSTVVVLAWSVWQKKRAKA